MKTARIFTIDSKLSLRGRRRREGRNSPNEDENTPAFDPIGLQEVAQKAAGGGQTKGRLNVAALVNARSPAHRAASQSEQRTLLNVALANSNENMMIDKTLVRAQSNKEAIVYQGLRAEV